MEVIGILIFLAILGSILVLPIIALIRGRRALDEVEVLRRQVEVLAKEVRGLKSQNAPGTSNTGPAPIVPSVAPASSSSPSPSPLSSQIEKIKEPTPTVSSSPAVVLTPSSIPAAAPIPAQTSASASGPAPSPASASGSASAAATPSKESSPKTPPPIPISTQRDTPSKSAAPKLNLEQFVGAKLIAWLGGLILFLAAAYFIKYSFDHDLIPKEVRAAMGFVLGISLVVGGFAFKRKAFEVTSQTFCATGILILYGVTFACRSIYHFSFFGPRPTFALMVWITACAFFLAVRMNAQVVAALGILGGFLTPILLSSGENNPAGLFGYIALLNAGLIAIVCMRPWSRLLVFAALGTIVMELGWSLRWLGPEDIGAAAASQIGFNLLFLAGIEFARRRGPISTGWGVASALLGTVSLGYAIVLVETSYVGSRIGVLGSICIVGDLSLLWVVFRTGRWPWLQSLAAIGMYGFLAFWMSERLKPENVFWALGWIFGTAIVHTVFPILLSKYQGKTQAVGASQWIPAISLTLLLMPVLQIPGLSLLLWPFVMGIDLLALAAAVLAGSILPVGVVFVLTGGLAAMWIMRVPSTALELTPLLLLVGGLAVFFFAVAAWVAKRYRLSSSGPGPTSAPAGLQHLPALAGLMPFLLLLLVVQILPLPNPSPVFALALALTVILLFVARAFQQPAWSLVTLVGVVALQWAWSLTVTRLEAFRGIAIGWHLTFASVLFIHPFLTLPRLPNPAQKLSWIASALSFPAHFFFLYQQCIRAWPTSFPGWIPAALSLPAFFAVRWIYQRFQDSPDLKNALLAWHGGAALFFITSIFPIQFDRQWITVSWALEGAALCWLFHRVPHRGLRWAGLGLLVVSFARLALNPAVLDYHPRSTTAIWNWYLYSYGIVIIAIFAAARWLAPPRDRDGAFRFPPLLDALWVVLLFLLVNIEIADYFSAPGELSLTFRFGGNLARDMAYTLAWALFALGLVSAGLRLHVRNARFAGLGLIGVTLAKLFLHDLSQLGQLYRIGALVGVAIVAIGSSILYQKFIASEPPETTPKSPGNDS